MKYGDKGKNVKRSCFKILNTMTFRLSLNVSPAYDGFFSYFKYSNIESMKK